MPDYKLAEALDRLMNSPADLRETLIALGHMRWTNLETLHRALSDASEEIRG